MGLFARWAAEAAATDVGVGISRERMLECMEAVAKRQRYMDAYRSDKHLAFCMQEEVRDEFRKREYGYLGPGCVKITITIKSGDQPDALIYHFEAQGHMTPLKPEDTHKSWEVRDE